LAQFLMRQLKSLKFTEILCHWVAAFSDSHIWLRESVAYLLTQCM
jgi:hypothetical protein